ncbi:helix-turn-helix transcriptional regulator [Geobacter sulfurreducens]|uniref:helix-turn-helix domain-containing protein n=1 Tax=Geobacter sulfurreducens TaxID=35554 RepID=UPI001BDDA500|nr:helix-turn-helix transcriptional regulator [Geobacter sulfurreducens]QVW35321.1 helix-turn-helix transcriptional regulator [Geobacter sulfurreducens]
MKESVELRKIISSRLAIARQNAGLSQAQVAAQLKLPRPSITEIEAGRRRVSVEEMVQFADLYEVDLNWLSGQGADQVDPVRDKLQLAARQVANLKQEDLEKVIDLLTSLRVKDTK